MLPGGDEKERGPLVQRGKFKSIANALLTFVEDLSILQLFLHLIPLYYLFLGYMKYFIIIKIDEIIFYSY